MSAPDTAAKARQIHIMLFGNEFVCAAITGAYCLSQNCKKRHAKFGNDSKIVWFVKKSVDFFLWRLYVKNMLRKEDAAILVVYFSQ